MLLRRRCGPSDCLFYFFVTGSTIIIILICTILYGTRTENPSLPSLIREVLPAGRCLCEFSTTFKCDSCLDCAANQAFLNNTVGGSDENHWSFKYLRDANNYGLDDDQCEAAFPGLFEDVDRAVKARKKNHVEENELVDVELTKGMVRAMIYDRELHILETHLVDNVNREKSLATLHSLHRALISTPHSTPLPNTEFLFTVEDLPADPSRPLWVLARRAQDSNLWLMPDFGFWSWAMPSLGTFSEVRDEVVAREKHAEERGTGLWETKIKKLVWRGKVTMAPKLRRALLEAARGQPWSDVGQVRWGEEGFQETFLSAAEQCKYMFIAHAEGRSYSGSLKYRQLCRSVIVSHKLQWIQHHHFLLKSNGPNQNYVEVERDFSDLESAMEDLLSHPEKAKRIANNSVRTFRERYLTPAAEACYWRRLVRGWGGVSWRPEMYESEDGKGVRTRKRGVRFETFALFDTQRQMAYPPGQSA